MKVKVGVLYTFGLTLLKLLFQGLGKHVFVAPGFLKEVYEND